MSSRLKHYSIVYLLVLAFVASILNIKYTKTTTDQDPEQDRKYRFLLPFIAMVCFFVGCYFISLVISEGAAAGQDKFSGIIFMVIIGLILLSMNASVLSGNNLTNYIKGKKFSRLGVFMALGVSSIVFGFLDNFGMKLGTEALDDNFLQAFLGPFSVDTRFKDYSKNITDNLQTMNQWVSSDWRKVVNHTLRFRKEIAKNSKFSDLTKAIDRFGGKPLEIPAAILKNRDVTNEYVDNLRSKFDIIDGSKSMLGNTFSDFIGALLGAGIVSLFVYMTCYDGTVVSEKLENNWVIKYLSYYSPITEAVFIALGCLVPVFLNIAMTRMDGNNNNFWSWVIVGTVAAIIVLMMYYSVQGITDMTKEDKVYSIKQTLNNLSDRIDLDSDPEIAKKVKNFVAKLT